MSSINGLDKVRKLLEGALKLAEEIEQNIEFIERNPRNSEQKIERNKILISNLKKLNEINFRSLQELDIEPKPLHPEKIYSWENVENRGENMKSKGGNLYSTKDLSAIGLEKETVKRLRKKIEESKKVEKIKKDSSEYSKFANKLFSKSSRDLLGKSTFEKLQMELIQANLNFTPVGYISIILLTTLISVGVAGFLFLFFLFFDFGATLPIITRATDPILERFIKVFWILFLLPVLTFLVMYIYPSLERKAAENKINSELPFATIHMAAISGSMVNPVKIFEIIILTKEYPALEKEFTKMINEINIYGYDLVSALKNTSKNSPSKRLSELLNGVATTINSGGDLVKFFDKRSETLLFDYKIQQQKGAKAAETFMDMYISLVIAAPMILMLLMMIMKISGLGVSMSIPMISLSIILGVVIINVVFLSFLQLKRSG